METLPKRTPRRGDVIAGRYLLREPLGSGAMGIVFAAELGPNQTVAIKVLHPDHAADVHAVRRFRGEAIAASYISHPNVVSVIDFSDPDDAAPFVVMERVRGIPLGTIIRRSEALPLRRAADIACQILAGLDAAHAAGVVHGDIKSDNILVERGRDDVETVKIIDFGLASIRRVDHPPPEPEHDARGQLLISGTPEYMAPEVIRGDGPIRASDLYAVGVIVYEMITGKTPFGHGTSAAILQRHVSEAVVPPSLRRPDRFIPIALERAVMRALEKDPAARYPTAAAFAAAIVAATPTTEPPPLATDVARPDAFSTEATTHEFVDHALERPRRRVVAGTPSGSTERLRRLRGELSTAVERGAIDAIVVTSLEIARTHVDDHRLWTAVRELEDSIALLANGADAADAPAPLWRLWLTLAALYQGVGDAKRARRAATAAHRHAGLHASRCGCDRAASLLERLPRPPPG